MRGLVVLLACTVACTDDARPRDTHPAKPEVDRRGADPSQGITTELDTASAAFGDGVLADLMGDAAAARAAFENVLASPESPPNVAARAALHLAQIMSREGNRRDAQDLVARAEAFAPNDPVIKDGADQLRRALVSSSSTGEVRGPPPNTPLHGVDPKVAEEFAAAEKTLATVNRTRLQPVMFESALKSLRIKEDATEGLVAKYRTIAEHGGLAAVAARYRAGSLYHDLALALFIVQLPGELIGKEQMRRLYRSRAWMFLERAAVEYRACLAVSPTPDAELWRLAAENDLKRATAVLEARGK